MEEPPPATQLDANANLESERARSKAAEERLRAELQAETGKLEACIADALEVATVRSNLEAQLSSLDQTKGELEGRLDGASARLKREAEMRESLQQTLAQRERDNALVAKWVAASDGVRGAAAKLDANSAAARDTSAAEIGVEVVLPEAFDAGATAPSASTSSALGRVCAYLQQTPGARVELRAYVPPVKAGTKAAAVKKQQAQNLASAFARGEAAGKTARACGSTAVTFNVAPASLVAAPERALTVRIVAPRVPSHSAAPAPAPPR